MFFGESVIVMEFEFKVGLGVGLFGFRGLD